MTCAKPSTSRCVSAISSWRRSPVVGAGTTNETGETSMQFRVLYFGVVRERVARTTKELVMLPAGATVDDLVSHLCETYPALRGALRHIKVAVNEDFGKPEQVLTDGD